MTELRGPFVRRRATGRWVALCAVVAGLVAPSSPASASQDAPGLDVYTQARVLIGHGQLDDAVRLAEQRPEGDNDAAAILSQADVRAGRYDQAEGSPRGGGR